MTGEPNNLTPKQQKFIAGFLQTGIAAEAYRCAYDASRMSPKTVQRKATALKKHGLVRARLDELLAPLREAAVTKANDLAITRERQIAACQQVFDNAMVQGQYSAALRALKLQSQLANLFVKKYQTTATIRRLADLSREELNEEFTALTRQHLAELSAR